MNIFIKRAFEQTAVIVFLCVLMFVSLYLFSKRVEREYLVKIETVLVQVKGLESDIAVIRSLVPSVSSDRWSASMMRRYNSELFDFMENNGPYPDVDRIKITTPIIKAPTIP